MTYERVEEFQNLDFTVETLDYGAFKLTNLDLHRDIPRIWQQYFAESHGLIFVVDASDRDKFDRARNRLHAIAAEPRLAKLPLLVLGNKADMEGSATGDEIATALDIAGVPQATREVRTCSVIDSNGVKEAVDWMIRAASADAVGLD
jgi:signal recognition particle receptor subunit beta